MKEEIQITSKHLKKNSTSLVIKHEITFITSGAGKVLVGFSGNRSFHTLLMGLYFQTSFMEANWQYM